MRNLQLLWAIAAFGILLSCDPPTGTPPRFELFTVEQFEIVQEDSTQRMINSLNHADPKLETGWFGSGWNVNENVHWTQTDGDYFMANFECTKFRIYFESHQWTGDALIEYADIQDTFRTYKDVPIELLDTIFYESAELAYNFHSVKITSLNEALGIRRFELLYSYPFFRKIITIKEFRDTCLMDSLRIVPTILL